MLKCAQSETSNIQASEFFDSFEKMRNFIDLSLEEFKYEL